MQIHQIKRDPTLQVPADMVHDDPVADVDDLEVRDARLSDRLVHGLVRADASQEVRLRLLRRHVLVVWVARGHLQRDVRRNDRRIVAERLEEDHSEALLAGDTLLDLVSTLAREASVSSYTCGQAK